MPLKYFKCLAGKIETKDCLELCPRPEGRCLSLPTLHELAKDRVWNGTPSTTQCLNGTRLEYLKIKCDYSIKPDDRAFALLGTRHHGRLEAVAKHIEGLDAEKKLTQEVSGILDLLEPNSEGYRLIDYKCVGAYAVSKMLAGDYGTYQLQLNNYRLMAEALGFDVSEMFIQATVRDGGTMVARSKKVFDRLYLIPVPKLEDDEVREYFLSQSYDLIKAVKDDVMPPKCPDTWDGRRCANYCDVKEFCQ